ncbi:MAG TPA: hypothetical protein VFB66_28265, partial [Tepidisphaeraceae bacterium]|nr:hypothetical protein [Tepidisphaeraceae bacterium]
RTFAIARVMANGQGLDPTFDTDGLVHPALGPSGGSPVAVFAGPADAVSAVGWGGPAADVTLVRVSASGAPDASFGGGDGIVTRRGYLRDDDAPATLVRQADGKLLALSSWADYTGDYRYYSALTRLLPDGTPDTTFGDFGTVPLSGVAQDVAAGAGRIVVTTHTGVYSLTPAGAPDAAFGGGDGLVEQPLGNTGSDVGVDSLGRVYVRRSGNLSRLARDGSPDTSFAGDGTLDLLPASPTQFGNVLIGPDDRVYVHATGAERLFRVNADGTQDMTYGGQGYAEVGHKAIVAQAADGSLLVGRTGGTGQTYEWQVEVRRLRPDGTFDPAYGDGGVARVNAYTGDYVDEIAGLAALPDGSVFASIGLPPYGGGTLPGSAVIKLTPRGTLDPQFDDDGQFFMPAASFPLLDRGLVVDDAGRPVLLGRVYNLGATRYGNWDTAVARLAPTDRPATTVVGRHVFYNGSAFDGRSTAADARDDNAVATDKRALLPGQSATFDNVTSYRQGINGVMIDLKDLPPNAVLGPGDFQLQHGRDGDPAGWGFIWGAVNVSLRRGAGVGGSDRVTITLPDEWAVRNEWLRVRVRSQFANTGLAADDVFYFGNLVGETGTSPAAGGWRVDAWDLARTRSALRTTAAPVTSRYDFNRDGRVSVLDWAVVRLSQRQTLSALAPPATGTVVPAVQSWSAARALLSEESEATALPGQ